MKLSTFIALRYLRSPKSHSVINLISWVAGVAIAVPTAALIIILSLHNGLTNTVENLYNLFDPQIRMTSATGKYFAPEELDFTAIKGVANASYSIEDNVLLRKGEREHPAIVRGVDSNFDKVVSVEELITHGKYELQHGDLPQMLVGQGVAYYLGISIALIESVDIYSIRPDNVESILPTPIYRVRSIIPSGVYALDEQTDNKYVFVPLEFAQELLAVSGRVSSVDIILTDGVDVAKVKTKLTEKYGDRFVIKTRFEQKESIYKAMNQEKLVIYFLLIMVMAIAALSLAGSIITLITDKRRHIDTLKSMGATTGLIRAIFRREGMLIVTIGSIVGLVIGTAFVLMQQHWGFVKMVGNNLLTDAYPVEFKISDFLVTLLGVWIMGWIISAMTSRIVIK